MDTMRVIEAYKECKSLKQIATDLHLSEVKVRRILITAGLWRSKTSDAIQELLDQNLSVAEVAEKLCITEKNVQAYMPYRKGAYSKEDASVSANRSRLYRERCQTAAANQVTRSPSPSEKLHSLNHTDGDNVQTLHLHLALITGNLNANSAQVLSAEGKVQASITRDVLVPSTITLHALHFLIQRAFGWQNSHLHHFALPEAIFSNCTEGSFQKWGELCGMLFRFPDMPIEELYWDNDYDGSVSIRSWMRKKYCGPYHYPAHCESYIACQDHFKAFVTERFSHETHSRCNIHDDPRTMIGLGDPNTLLERLTIGELMLPCGLIDVEHDCSIISMVTHSLRYFYDYGDNWEVEISLVKDSPEAENHPEIASTEKPLCIAADGLDVLENIGGIPGYCQFLCNLRSSKEHTRASAQEHALIYGWTGKHRNVSSIV